MSDAFYDHIYEYLRYKYATRNAIIKKRKHEFNVQIKSKTQTITVQETLNNVTNTHIYCKNTKQNVQFLLNHWQEFSKLLDCKVTFFNDQTQTQWSIYPHAHAKITPDVAKSVTILFENNS
ncbi:MAG: hypothetical protein ACMXYF_02970 [Candidatus Woesearchaeota archaeon]